MYLFFNGVIAMGCFVAALFFQRMLRRTNDRLFLFFAIAFAILALERLVLSVLNTPETTTPIVYLMRFAAFIFIIIGIVGKNVKR